MLDNKNKGIQQDDRRRSPRSEPQEPMRISRVVPVMPLSDAQVIDVSSTGVAIRCPTPLKPGERLSFSTSAGAPPVLAQVLACEPLEENLYRIRCKCLLGGFDAI